MDQIDENLDIDESKKANIIVKIEQGRNICINPI